VGVVETLRLSLALPEVGRWKRVGMLRLSKATLHMVLGRDTFRQGGMARTTERVTSQALCVGVCMRAM
jgi:hypothetical protein